MRFGHSDPDGTFGWLSTVRAAPELVLHAVVSVVLKVSGTLAASQR
jgi:hypothetical protein